MVEQTCANVQNQTQFIANVRRPIDPTARWSDGSSFLNPFDRRPIGPTTHIGPTAHWSDASNRSDDPMIRRPVGMY